ncbi:hypothetical protein [Hathewaya massiliensis]|uniref:hypothetical protein n=1 Tax=Hathewaya massiliensis TaxID=1964382 RepID=UPI001158DDC6|nr:hypothetical protein [Hathewaya massiliensis]
MNKEKAFMKQKNNPNVNPNKNLQNKEEVKNRIADIWSTLDEATSYLKNNIDNKDKREEISDLIDDCISALNSIENTSTKIKDKNAVDATKDIKKIKEDFKELKKAFTEYNLDRCKKILNQNKK